MPDRIRILLSIADLSGGGAEREFATLLSHLSRERFDPHVCLHRPVFDYALPADVPLHILNRTRPWHTPRTLRRIARLVDDLAPDLVFSQLHYVNMLTGSALARCRVRPRWICRQVNDPRRDMQGLFAAWARRSLARADRVLGCCDGVSGALVEHLRLDPARVETLVNAVDVERIERLAREPLEVEKRPEVFTLVHAGRLSAQKNQTLLLEAFRRLLDAPRFRGGQRAELWMLGAGELGPRLQAHAEHLGVAASVRWLGFRANPYPFFRAADCFVLTSDHEGLPNAVIEAMVCGTPSVATRCRYGPEDLIDDGETGLLAPPGDVGAVADALAILCADPKRAAQMGARARERAAARFDTSTVCGAYQELFERVAGGEG